MFDRIIKPSQGQLFYHYCSNETLLSICQNKTLRFSDINMMNDYAEAAYGYRIFEEAAGRLLALSETQKDLEGIDKAFFDSVDEIVSPIQGSLQPVMCSFSTKPDVLSQWRAYSNDGAGVSIGFSAEAIAALPVTVMTVEYDREVQVREMMGLLAALYSVEVTEGHKRGADFDRTCLDIAMYKLAYKNPAFSEEQEVRCIHLLTVNWDEDSVKLIDEGGVSLGKEVPGQPVKFLVRNNGFVAHVDLPLAPVEGAVGEIWLGPKNDNAVGNIMYMLSGYGFKKFKIFHSKASYR